MNDITINTEVEVNLDFNDVYANLSDSDTKELVEWLIEDEVIKPNSSIKQPFCLNEQIFFENVSKIRNNYTNLSIEEINYIEQISKKL